MRGDPPQSLCARLVPAQGHPDVCGGGGGKQGKEEFLKLSFPLSLKRINVLKLHQGSESPRGAAKTGCWAKIPEPLIPWLWDRA